MSWGPYPSVRDNQARTEQVRNTEAGYARVEYEQLLYCSGEALPGEPVFFGRAFERPPFFSYASVGGEQIPVGTDCGGTDRKFSGLTIGISDWIRDERGMYVGALPWYKLTTVDVDRATVASGNGLVGHTFTRDTSVVVAPDCLQRDDVIVLIALAGDYTQGQLSISPSLGTKKGWGAGAIQPTRGFNGMTFIDRVGFSPQEAQNVYTASVHCEWMALMVLRGGGEQNDDAGNSINSGSFFVGSSYNWHSPKSSIPNPYIPADSIPLAMDAETAEDWMFGLFAGFEETAGAAVVNNLGMEILDPGPTLDDATPAFILTGKGNRADPDQEAWADHFSSFYIDSASGWTGIKYRVW